MKEYFKLLGINIVMILLGVLLITLLVAVVLCFAYLLWLIGNTLLVNFGETCTKIVLVIIFVFIYVCVITYEDYIENKGIE